MSNREIILSRIRKALSVAAPHPGFHDGVAERLPGTTQKWLPPSGQTPEETMGSAGKMRKC